MKSEDKWNEDKWNEDRRARIRRARRVCERNFRHRNAIGKSLYLTRRSLLFTFDFFGMVIGST